MRCLFSKPRRSLYKLRLKFVQTTAEVSRKYYVLINLSMRKYRNEYSVLTETSTAYSPKRVQRTHQNEYSVLTETSTAYSPKRVRRTHQNKYAQTQLYLRVLIPLS